MILVYFIGRNINLTEKKKICINKQTQDSLQCHRLGSVAPSRMQHLVLPGFILLARLTEIVPQCVSLALYEIYKGDKLDGGNIDNIKCDPGTCSRVSSSTCR